jgi:hypothetical protein
MLIISGSFEGLLSKCWRVTACQAMSNPYFSSTTTSGSAYYPSPHFIGEKMEVQRHDYPKCTIRK